VLFYDLEHAMEDPLWVLQIWTGGLASHGAVIGLIVAMWLFTRRRGVPFFEGADRFAFSAALGATLVRLGNLFNSEIVGRVVPDQSWGFRFPRFDTNVAEAPLRYPTQLFEFTLGLVVLLALYLTDRWAGQEKRPRGLLISTFFVVYFGGRFGIEFFKEYEAIDPSSPLTMGQLLSILPFFMGVFGVFASLRSNLPAGWTPAAGAIASHPATDEDDEEDEDEGADEGAGIDPDVPPETAISWGT
jgi:prolipoprotein diacylglyceryl transferase